MCCDYISLNIVELIIALYLICLVFYVPMMDSFLNSVPLNTSGNLSVFSSVVFLGEVTPGIMVSGPDLDSALSKYAVRLSPSL